MAVKQERMLKTITAGINFRDAFERIVLKLAALEGLTHNPTIDIPSIRQEIGNIRAAAYIPFPTVVSDSSHLNDEYKHFQRYYRQNQKHAAAATRRRRAKGISPQPQPIPIQMYLTHSSPPYLSTPPMPPSNDPSQPLTPNFQTIPASERSDDPPPLPPGVPPMPPDTDPDAQLEWYEKHGKYLPNN